MVEKTLITALIGMIASISYVELADTSDDILDNTHQVAAAVQERELINALELFYLDEGTYPDVRDEAVVEELHKADLLRNDKLAFDVAYTLDSSHQRYELSVK